MRPTIFLWLFSLLLLGGPSHAAKKAESSGVSIEIAYDAYIDLLAAVAEKAHHSYLHVLGNAFKVNVDRAPEQKIAVHRLVWRVIS